MESNDIMKYLPQIILAIGAIIGIVAMFLSWFKGGDVNWTGKDLMNITELAWQKYIPLVILILGIVALIVACIPLFGVEIDAKILNGIIAVVGIIMVILFIVFFMYTVDGTKFGDHLQVGAWLGLVAGLVPVVVGALGFFGVFDNLTGGSNAGAQ